MKFKSLAVLLMMLAQALTLQADPEAMPDELIVDPQYRTLAPSFQEKQLAPGYLEIFEYFLRGFDGQYARFFNVDDGGIISRYAAGWFDKLLEVYEEASEFADATLSPIEAQCVDEPRPDLMMTYAIALEEADNYRDVIADRLASELGAELSSDGAAALEKLLRVDVYAAIENQYLSGSRSKGTINNRRFAETYPEVLARQIHLEAAAGIWERKPGKLVWEVKAQAAEASGSQQLRVLTMVRKDTGSSTTGDKEAQ